MVFRSVFSTSCTAFLLLSACAAPPPPEPIRTEPVFNKYGEALCRPVDRPVSTAYPADLPICEDYCENGVPVAGAPPQIVCPPPPTGQRPASDGSSSDTGRGQTGAAGAAAGN